MLMGNSEHQKHESNIFEDFTLYKVRNTKKGLPAIVHLDGSISVVVKFDGINNTSKSEGDFEEMFKRVQSVIDDVTNPDISIQFVMVRDSKIPKLDDNIELLPSFLKPRAENLKNLANNYQLFVNKFYFAIHCSGKKPPQKEIFKKWISKQFQKDSYKVKALDEALSGIEHRMNAVFECADTLMNMLVRFGSNPRLLQTKDEYYEMIQEFTRPSKSKLETYKRGPNGFQIKDEENKIKGTVKFDDNQEFPRQALFSGVRTEIANNYFELDNYFHKIYTLDRSPKDFIYGKTIDILESVDVEFIYSITFKVVTHDQAIGIFKRALGGKRILAGKNRSSWVEDRSLDADERRISEMYDKFAFGQARGALVSANFVVRVRGDMLLKMAKDNKLSKEDMIVRLDQQIHKDVFANFGYSEWVNEGSFWKVFCKLIPGFSTMSSMTLKNIFLTTADIPYFLAMYENKQPLVHNGTNHFIDHRKNALVFDLCDPQLPAWNYSISGQTGSGKSMLMNTLLTMQFAELAITGQKPIICILDVGGDRGSYKKMMTLSGGSEINLSGVIKPSIQMLELKPERSLPTPDKVKKIVEYFLPFSHDKNTDKLEIKVRAYFTELLNKGNQISEQDLQDIFLNTFDFEEKPEYRAAFKLQPGECEPSPQVLNLIMAVLEVMLSSNIKVVDGFKFFDYDEIQTTLLETYRQTPGRFPYLSDFLRVAEERSDLSDPELAKTANRFKMKMTAWTRNGANPMFDSDTSINLDNDVILADLKGLESYPQLQVIYTLLISQLFNDKMYYIRDRRKLMVRDEAWSIMKNDRARSYFVEDLRTARKNGFATISITQLPTDYLYPSEQDGKAILGQMQVHIFCKFSNPQFAQETARQLELGPEVLSEMKTLGVQTKLMSDGSFKKTHAKFMVIKQSNEKVDVYSLFNIVHPFEYILYSSSADDNAIVDFYLKQKKSFKNLEDVLWYIANNQHLGDLELADYLEKGNHATKAREIRGKKRS